MKIDRRFLFLPTSTEDMLPENLILATPSTLLNTTLTISIMTESELKHQTSLSYEKTSGSYPYHASREECKFAEGVHPHITFIDLRKWQGWKGSNGIHDFLFDAPSRSSQPRFPNLQSLVTRPIVTEQDAEAFSKLEKLTELHLIRFGYNDLPIIPLKLDHPLDKLSYMSLEFKYIGNVFANIPIRILIDMDKYRTEDTGLSKIQGLEAYDGFSGYSERFLEVLSSNAGTLQHLSIHDGISTGLEYLATFKRLRSLKMLWYGDTDQLAVALAELPDLTCLDIWKCTKGNPLDISFLSPLVNLTHLRLRQDLHSSEPLGSLVNLKALSLSGCKLKEVNGLATMLQLEILDISHNQIVNIEPLRNLTKIHTLFANHNKITSFAYLAGYEEIRVLDCSRNPLDIFGGLGNPLQSYQYDERRDSTVFMRGKPSSWEERSDNLFGFGYSKKDEAFFPYHIEFQM